MTRVTLRRPRAEDRDEFVDLARASRDLHNPWVTAPVNAREFDTYLIRAEADDTDCNLVCLRDSGAITGVFNLSQIVHGMSRSTYVGFYAFAPFAGQGYMTEGLRLVLDRVFDELSLHRIEANIQPDNIASKRLVARCEFRYEGFSPRYLYIAGGWRDHERWAITVDERPGATHR
ncbi:MAG: GNAT family N-acetyltransferase [Actinobacteria bacterium]|nr:GNAT family N-acetyltransferase [Actinomycetota bacterium]